MTRTYAVARGLHATPRAARSLLHRARNRIRSTRSHLSDTHP